MPHLVAFICQLNCLSLCVAIPRELDGVSMPVELSSRPLYLRQQLCLSWGRWNLHTAWKQRGLPRPQTACLQSRLWGHTKGEHDFMICITGLLLFLRPVVWDFCTLFRFECKISCPPELWLKRSKCTLINVSQVSLRLKKRHSEPFESVGVIYWNIWWVEAFYNPQWHTSAVSLPSKMRSWIGADPKGRKAAFGW